ncbi:hypothetical protein Daes_2076 [Pseudodesulfovibrio aespoeensis Aspo-2]|uniref:Peptidase M15C domain-containing protein n=1 Tax=Pseudodesulfovibrio aespoeensis (strain ATCC 700646 / DSM 10631 / Aspo-2) TaxID=643562 RepID=E6VS38_PSEA9|nr:MULTISPECIES: M15 family metallopeptidase [Pseudodesulfovibrio]ADU63083.1 hypothetical protein Daes_2076 [Pseudodesulfovibrio aespoeensis Aspo-2]
MDWLPTMLRHCVVHIILVCLLFAAGCAPVVFDSRLNASQAIWDNQPPGVAAEVQDRLVLVPVRYYGFDGRLHQGQVVIHRDLAQDIRMVFAVIRATRFPVESVIPVAHPLIQEQGVYGLSPDTNNTSAYVWRFAVGENRLSMHALGLAIDINPRLNPYVRGDLALPPGATYDPAVAGTLTADHPVVLGFRRLGWKWGGHWGSRGRVDPMHFQKIPRSLAAWVAKWRE